MKNKASKQAINPIVKVVSFDRSSPSKTEKFWGVGEFSDFVNTTVDVNVGERHFQFVIGIKKGLDKPQDGWKKALQSRLNHATDTLCEMMRICDDVSVNDGYLCLEEKLFGILNALGHKLLNDKVGKVVCQKFSSRPLKDATTPKSTVMVPVNMMAQYEGIYLQVNVNYFSDHSEPDHEKTIYPSSPKDHTWPVPVQLYVYYPTTHSDSYTMGVTLTCWAIDSLSYEVNYSSDLMAEIAINTRKPQLACLLEMLRGEVSRVLQIFDQYWSLSLMLFLSELNLRQLLVKEALLLRDLDSNVTRVMHDSMNGTWIHQKYIGDFDIGGNSELEIFDNYKPLIESDGRLVREHTFIRRYKEFQLIVNVKYPIVESKSEEA